MDKPNILVADDEDRMRHLLSVMLQRNGYKVDQAQDGLEALKMIKENPYDLLISDIKMPGLDGMGLLKELRKEENLIPVIFITAFATVESSVEAMKAGASDYITKPFEEERIIVTVNRCLDLSRVMAENRRLKEEIKNISYKDNIIYASKQMQDVMNLGFRVAATLSVVMITGASGTGKELLARYIHKNSDRKNNRFVPLNCAAITPTLVESELFGYEKGAFTGAESRKRGKFEYATKGTLFLDEIGDMPLEAQAKLLRALQEQRFQRVGGNKEIPVDVRIICATNQDLKKMVAKGAFRSDLLYRINVFPIEMPALRQRPDDIVPLAKYFLTLQTIKGDMQLTQGACRILKKYHWPGNVRELQNVIERAVILVVEGGTISSETLSFLDDLGVLPEEDKGFVLPENGISLEKFQLDLAKQALEKTNNNQTAAARLLGMTRAKFRVLMRRDDD
ncbi:MAG: sigma-54 dependent transcriptional regulator [Desulfobacula sp.]|uniref:sigma-54-dependent transcriptional regulator n=1 Tax=Desulfobacula sp. TaxID=2593537 RepID=UPI0025B8B501|nr:sigma-54 dependent transcriptional regulator [Desulfobacula sp.]MCD4721259.1 sigma-54 dependent transcriptional regulator [Desulfobacula sp.]